MTTTNSTECGDGWWLMTEDGDGEVHPAWCSPQHCYVTEPERVRVHQQAVHVWEDEAVLPLRCETALLGPTDEDGLYLELTLWHVKLKQGYAGVLPVEVARRLRDQLTEHLDAAGVAR